MSEMTKFGADLIQAMSEALAHSQGKDVPGIKVYTVDVGAVDAKAIRKKLDLTQDEMATVLGTSPSGYKKWEQGVRQPSGAARTLLRVMDREPEAVLRALSSDDTGAGNREAAHCQGRGGGFAAPYSPEALVRLTRKRSRRR